MSATGRPARVVRVITRLNIGGPARQALLLTKHLRDEFPTTLLAGHAGPAEGELRDPDVPVQVVPLVRPLDAGSDARAMRAVRRVLRDQRPALVHTHMAKAGTVGRVAARSIGGARPRTVHTFHGHVLEGYFSPVVERAFIGIERVLARVTDRLIAVSPEVKDELLALGIGRPSQYEVVPLGLDLSGFLRIAGPSGALRGRLGLAADVPLVGIVGRLVRVKAVEVLLDAVRELPGVHLAVVGDGDERAALEARARQLDIAGRVHFTGWSPDVPATVSDLDVVALSSRNEGTPVALIEALAARRPVVATRVGGVEHVVVPDRTGLVVPPNDPAALAGAIRTLLGDPGLAGRLAAAGRDRVARRFSADRLVEDMRALYRELL